MPGRKKKLNAKQKSENQKRIEHKKQKEEEEAARPKSFNEPGPSTAPGYPVKKSDDSANSKNDAQNSRVPATRPSCDSKDLLLSLKEELMSLREKWCKEGVLPNIPSGRTCDQDLEAFASLLKGGEATSEAESAIPEELPKVEASEYIRKVTLSSRHVNHLSRPNHVDLYDMYFKMALNLEYLSNYAVHILVAKNKNFRKPFLKKITNENVNQDLKDILTDLPEYRESHRKPADIANFLAQPDHKREELRRYIDNLTVQELPEPEPQVEINQGIIWPGEVDLLDDPQWINQMVNPFLRAVRANVQNTVPVFKVRPEVTDLSLPRLTILAALIGQKKNFKKIRPALTTRLIADDTPQRFISKFLNLLAPGYAFLGKLIIASLSPDEKINRGNVFQFMDGDVGFWWAGVIILDWNEYLLSGQSANKYRNPAISCVKYMKEVGEGSVAYRAMLNLGPDGLYFTEQDQTNFQDTIENIKHKRMSGIMPEGINDPPPTVVRVGGVRVAEDFDFDDVIAF